MSWITSWYGVCRLRPGIVIGFKLLYSLATLFQTVRLAASRARLSAQHTTGMNEQKSETSGEPHPTPGQAESRLLMLPDQRQTGFIATLPAEVPPVRQFPAKHLVTAIQLKSLYTQREGFVRFERFEQGGFGLMPEAVTQVQGQVIRRSG